jgi:hypothetical protein
MTYRQRREARAERYREWADKREAKAKTELEQAQEMSSIIPLGQPILVGHHSEKRDRNYRNRISGKYERARENADKADTFRSRADEIERQADNAIYSDDPDAIERLEERIAELEAERTRIKAFNTALRKGMPGGDALQMLTPKERQDYAVIARVAPFQLGPKGELPSYKLSNLGGNINRQKKRLASLQRKAESHE